MPSTVFSQAQRLATSITNTLHAGLSAATLAHLIEQQVSTMSISECLRVLSETAKDKSSPYVKEARSALKKFSAALSGLRDQLDQTTLDGLSVTSREGIESVLKRSTPSEAYRLIGALETSNEEEEEQKTEALLLLRKGVKPDSLQDFAPLIADQLKWNPDLCLHFADVVVDYLPQPARDRLERSVKELQERICEVRGVVRKELFRQVQLLLAEPRLRTEPILQQLHVFSPEEGFVPVDDEQRKHLLFNDDKWAKEFTAIEAALAAMMQRSLNEQDAAWRARVEKNERAEFDENRIRREVLFRLADTVLQGTPELLNSAQAVSLNQRVLRSQPDFLEVDLRSEQSRMRGEALEKRRLTGQAA